jgi:hypothetical protein
MKKLIIVLLALSVFGVMAFAQEAPALALSGSLYSGFQLDGATTINAKLWDSNGGYPSDFWLDAALNGTAAGLKFEIFTDTNPILVNCDVLFGWWKPIDMLSLKGGVGYGATYTTPIEGWGHGGTGFLVQLAVAGATVGVEYPFAIAPAAFDATKIIFAASYALTDIATLGAGYDLGGQYAWAGVSVKAVKDLKANIDFNYSVAAPATFRVEGDFGYTIMGIAPGLWVYYTSATGSAWGAKVYASYAMDTITPGAYFTYNADASWAGGANVAFAVEKQTVNVYGDFKSGSVWDFGVNFKMAF